MKKCFFEEYRFSEDLDFTLIDASQVNESYLLQKFLVLSEWVYEQSGVEIPRSSIRFEVYENKQGKLSVEGRLSYRGPMLRRGDLSRIKLDLTSAEKIVLMPENRQVFHPYSDSPDVSLVVKSYCFEEIFAEKIRALTERLRPRDLYDVIHLYKDKRWQPDKGRLMYSLQEKCHYKNIEVPTMAALGVRPEMAELQVEWQNMLAHQIYGLDSFDTYWQALPDFFEWLLAPALIE